jgi:hypothetical protein
MKPSERVEALLEDIAAFDNVRLSKQSEDEIVSAITAAERAAFEAGVLQGVLWSDGSLDSEYEIAKEPTYDDWRRDES